MRTASYFCFSSAAVDVEAAHAGIGLEQVVDRCSTAGPTCCRAGAPGSACRRAPCPCRTSSAACRARSSAAPRRAASPAPRAAPPPSRTPPAACRNPTRHMHAEVLEAELARAFVRELDEALVVLAHRLGDRVPALPGLELARRSCGSSRARLRAGRRCSGSCPGPFGQYLPAPYIEVHARSRASASSARFAGSSGAGAGRLSFSSSIARCGCRATSAAPSYAFASAISLARRRRGSARWPSR